MCVADDAKKAPRVRFTSGERTIEYSISSRLAPARAGISLSFRRPHHRHHHRRVMEAGKCAAAAAADQRVQTSEETDRRDFLPPEILSKTNGLFLPFARRAFKGILTLTADATKSGVLWHLIRFFD